MIGIISAMKIEIESFKKSMTNKIDYIISGVEFTTGVIQGVECVVAFGGIGKVNSAMCTQTMILKFNVSSIINIGVAGSISSQVHLTDIVVADSVIQYDVDTSALGDPVGMISGPNMIKFPCDKELRDVILRKGNFHSGTLITGDRFLADDSEKARLKELFSAIACDMESGAIGQVCYLNKVKFIAIRAITDAAGEQANTQYDNMLEYSAEKTIQVLISIITENKQLFMTAYR